MILNATIFVIGFLFGALVSFGIIIFYAKSLSRLMAKIIRLVREDNAKYMSESLTSFKEDIFQETLFAQHVIDEHCTLGEHSYDEFDEYDSLTTKKIKDDDFLN